MFEQQSNGGCIMAIMFILTPGAKIPDNVPLSAIDISRLPNGTILATGTIGIALAGTLHSEDVKFLLTDKGMAFWDANVFDDLNGKVRITVEGGGFLIRNHLRCIDCSNKNCVSHPVGVFDDPAN